MIIKEYIAEYRSSGITFWCYSIRIQQRKLGSKEKAILAKRKVYSKRSGKRSVPSIKKSSYIYIKRNYSNYF